MTQAGESPQIVAIRRRTRDAYMKLQALLDSVLAHLEADKLYTVPEVGEWTLMENLAHIVEFMPYWADEVARLVAQPGQNFGRTMQHAGRLNAISEHGHDNLQQAKQMLPASYEHLDRVLSTLKDSDLTLKGHHSKFGDQELGWFIEEFITKHLEAHLTQIDAALTRVQE